MKKKVLIGIVLLLVLVAIIFFLYFKLDIKKAFISKLNLESNNNENNVIQNDSANNFDKLSNSQNEFSINEAIEYGYVVITVEKIYNKESLYKFIENTGKNSKNKISSQIKIITYNINNEPTIYDIEYYKFNKDSDEYGYRLIVDNSMVHSIESYIDYNNSIKVYEEISENVYSMNIVEDKSINAGIILLSVNKNANLENETKMYNDIEITRFILNE